MSAFRVTVTYDPTQFIGTRWSFDIHDADERFVAGSSFYSTRRRAERAARRHLSRVDGVRAYTFQIPEVVQ